MKRPEPQQDYSIDEARQLGMFDDDSMSEEEAAESFDGLDEDGAVPNEDDEEG